MVSNPHNLLLSVLSGDVLERVRRLELFSRLRVEGARHGDNASPLRGFSTDFMQHRAYCAGDNLRYLDWRILAKTDRLFIREYEEHTNAEMIVLVDLSGSMRFHGETAFSKYEYAVRCAGILLYMMLQQRDTFSLYFFGGTLTPAVRRGGNARHLGLAFDALVRGEPKGATRFDDGVRLLETMVGRRGLVIVLSDFMDDPPLIARSLARLRRRRHDLIALQLYDPREASLPFVDFTRFRDLEDGSLTGVDPQLVRREYERQFTLHQRQMKEACFAQGIDHTLLPVSDSYDTAIGEYLRHRAALLL